MPGSPLSVFVQRLGAAAGRAGAGRTDGELLTDFLSRRDADALAALVSRHAPMVWGVCRRVLRDPHDAEDAFQATFLVLARKAGTVVPREAVANWLHGVARQTAVRMRSAAARRGRREVQADRLPEPAVAEARDEELLSRLDEELGRLPERLRALVVLCDLEGHTRKEAARRLGCPEGTVASGLARARGLLARRMARRGLAASGGWLAALSHSASAGVPAAAVTSAIRVATLSAAGSAAGATSGPVAALTQGVLRAMFLKKITTTAAGAILALGVAVTAGGGALAHLARAVGPRETAEGPPPEPVADAPVPEAKPKEDKDVLRGTWHVVEAQAGGKHQAIETSKDQVWDFTDDRLVINYDDTSRREMSFRIDPKQKPKAIDLFPTDEREKGYVFRGIYELGGDRLRLYYGRGVAADTKRPERFDPAGADRGMRSFVLKRAPDGEAFTAWGEEAGGLRAGLGLLPGARRAYRHGEAVTLVVRVRNVGKKAVTFGYVRQFLDENRPAVTDAGGRGLTQAGTSMLGVHGPTEVTLEAGREVVLGTRLHGASGSPHTLLPVGSGAKAGTKEWPLFVGTGKVSLRYGRVLGNSSSGFITLDPALGKLATGTLELEVEEAPKGKAECLTPEEAVRAASDPTRLKGFNAAKPWVEFKVEAVTGANGVRVVGASGDAAVGGVGLRSETPPDGNLVRFGAVLTAHATRQLSRAGVRDLDKHFRGKTVRVTGTLSRDDLRIFGRPTEVEVVVDDLGQLEVVD